MSRNRLPTSSHEFVGYADRSYASQYAGYSFQNPQHEKSLYGQNVEVSFQECKEPCRSEFHGNIICSALTKRDVTDQELCSYLDYVCCSSERVKDRSGRTALHVAASCGRNGVVRWLVVNKGANINCQDRESGYTPLHRSLIYGQIETAVLLIKLGAKTDLYDLNGLTCFEQVMKDIKDHTKINLEEDLESETYLWGSNNNYTLGLQHARDKPDLCYSFCKEFSYQNIKKVVLGKFHAVTITKNGKVFTSGHGHGGRLGYKSEGTVTEPKKVEFRKQDFTVTIENASVSSDHTMFLDDTGYVWTCGINTNYVLGLDPPPSNLFQPVRLRKFGYPINGIHAATYHSLAWTHRDIFTWGRNVGQLGHHLEYVITPREMHRNGTYGQIVQVASSDYGIAFLTSNGEVEIYFKRHWHKLKNKPNKISAIAITGGASINLETSKVIEQKRELTLAVINEACNLYIWTEKTGFSRCIFTVGRPLELKQLFLNNDDALFVTFDGEAFKGSLKLKRSMSFLRKNESDTYEAYANFEDPAVMKIEKIAQVYRAVSIYSDLEGKNFVVHQEVPNILLTKIPNISPSTMREEMWALLNDPPEIGTWHDMIFDVEEIVLRAHKFVVASNSSTLYDRIMKNKMKTINIKGIHPSTFRELLTFMYTGTCPTLKALKCPCNLENFEVDEDSEVDQESIYALRNAADIFQVGLLVAYFTDKCSNGETHENRSFIPPFELNFHRNNYMDLPLITLKTSDDVELYAHKCILCARVEYFKNVFSERWASDTKGSITVAYPSCVINYVLDYIYTDKMPAVEHEDVDRICEVLMAADEFLIQRLKDMCEYTLSVLVNLKNVHKIFNFAHKYNALQLKTYCMEFICVHLVAVLESKCLDKLDSDVLQELTDFYCKMYPRIEYRSMSPYKNAPTTKQIVKIAKSHPVSIAGGRVRNPSSKKSLRKRRSKAKRLASKLNPDDSNTSDDERVSSEEDDEEDPKILFYDKLITEACARGRFCPAVKSIIHLRDKLKKEKVTTNFVNLSNIDYKLNKMKDDFPTLNSDSVNDSFQKLKTSFSKADFKKKIPKLSQKERKRLSSEGGSSNPSENAVSAPIDVPKNPWKICAEPEHLSSPMTSPVSPVDMNLIISDEKKQIENFVKMKSKLLKYTQIEDKALDDLRKFYNTDNVDDEIITVERVQMGQMATPKWVPQSRYK